MNIDERIENRRRIIRLIRGDYTGLTPDSDVSDAFDIEGIGYLPLRNLMALWEAGFGIISLVKNQPYQLSWFNNHTTTMREVSVQVYNFWASIILQLCEPVIKTTAVSVTPMIQKSLYSRSICCLSAYRTGNSVEQNEVLHARLKQQIKDLGYFPIELRGVFLEEGASNSDEYSYLIMSNKDDTVEDFRLKMFDLGVQYNQDCILLRNKGEEKAYYLGTNHSKNPGFKNIKNLGVLIPNKVTGFGSVPIKFSDGKENYKDSFSFWIGKYDRDTLPEVKTAKGPWKLVKPNIYSNGNGRFMYVMKRRGYRYSGYTTSIFEAAIMLGRIKSGKNIPTYVNRKKLTNQ